MLREIELYNWKTHGQTKLSFQKGVNVLIGIMGAGKSSVMDAICFALFGTYPALKQRRIKLENAIRNRPKKEDEAEVRLSFTVGSDLYTVTRRFSSSGGATARLDRNGSHLQTQPQRVTEEVSSLLKVDYDTFARAVYAEQNGLDYFLNIAKGDRKKQIDGMLGLDHFAGAEENCTSLINSIKSMITDEERMLSGMDVGAMQSQLGKTAADREATASALARIKEDYSKHATLLTQLAEKVETQRKAFKRKEELSRHVIEINGRLQALKGEVDKLSSEARGAEAAKLEEELAVVGARERQLGGTIDEAEKREKELLRLISQLAAAISNDKKRLAERDALARQLAGKDPESVKKSIAAHNSALSELMKSEAEYKSRLSDIGSSLNELRKHMAKCPVCERELDEALRTKLMAVKDEEIRKLSGFAEQSSKSIAEKRKVIRELEEEKALLELAASRLKDYANLGESLKANSDKHGKYEKEYSELSGALKKAKLEMDSVRDKMQKLRTTGDLLKRREVLEAELKRHSETAQKSKAEADSINVSADELDFLQDSLSKENAAVATLGALVEGNEKQIAAFDSSIASLTKQIDGIRALEQRVESRKTLVRNLNLFKSALIETEAMLRTRLIRSINGLLQSVWPEIYPYQDYAKLRLDARPDDYLLESCVSNAGSEEWVPIDSVASGGERSIACLAMRIAMSLVIVPNLRWLILDEPTHNIDANGIAKLIGVFSDALPRVIDQVFIITHDESLKQIASAKVYQFDREKASGGSTTVQEL